jgi:lantibiotic modifying enzyme
LIRDAAGSTPHNVAVGQERGLMDVTSVAAEAFNWVDSVGVDTGIGRGWCEGATLSDDLYVGTAGVLLGCAEGVVAGLDLARIAAGARDRLIGLSGEPINAILDGDGLFTGWSGVGVALRAWSRAVEDDESAHAAALIAATVSQRVRHGVGDAPRYRDVIEGDAGILLASVDDGSAPAVAAAHVLADRLLRAGELTGAGEQWRMVDGDTHVMPGFSHGTAGVAFALACAAGPLGRADLLAAAIRGAEELIALSGSADGGGWAVPLIIPAQAHRPSVSFGWCHGPTGVVRLFALLDAIDPQPRWRAAIAACVQALRDSRLPERLYPGYWDNLGRCCGTAGVGQLLLDRFLATGDSELLDQARTLAADVMARRIHPGGVVAWSNTEHTAKVPELPPEPGFMQGAAGIAPWLARLAAPPERIVTRDPAWV